MTCPRCSRQHPGWARGGGVWSAVCERCSAAAKPKPKPAAKPDESSGSAKRKSKGGA